MEKSWKIYWREYSSNFYLYGSVIRFYAKDDVYFENELMPAGTVIKEWYSKTNYQAMRIEPELPIIDGESKYSIQVNISGCKEGTCMVRFVFFDRYESEIGHLNVKSPSMDFQCPLKTYSYRVQLINAGVTSFHFHSLVITEKE